MAIYEITADQIRKIPETTFSLAGLRERYDLQRLLRSQFDVISPDTLIIAEGVGKRDSSHCRTSERFALANTHWEERL
jgi:hypothetical protein